MSDDAMGILKAIHEDVDRMEAAITRFLAHLDEQITGIQTRKDRQMDEEEEIRRMELETRRMAAELQREQVERDRREWECCHKDAG